MTKDYSPFTPGVPVPVEFFVGRGDEIRRLETKVAQATTGRIQVAFLSGERGIGKSSLAAFVRQLVEKQHQMLGLHVLLGGVSSLTEMVHRVFDKLLNESVDRKWYEKTLEFFGDHVTKVGLFGINLELKANPEDLQHMVRHFAPALRQLCRKLQDEKKGLLIVLDDINGLASSEEFANWLKSLVDEIATSGEPLPLCLFLVGLDERRQSLMRLQPSLGRILDPFEIRAWTEDETREFFANTFAEVGVPVDEEALADLAAWAGGLPMLAHEIGDAVFRTDTDGHIDEDDVMAGAVNAAEIVGRKHLEMRVLQAIRSDRYRSIIAKMHEVNLHFTRAEVRALLDPDERKVFDSFLSKMVELGVLVREPEGAAGSYRFHTLLHWFLFDIEAERHAESRRGPTQAEPGIRGHP
jgi:Cdc6-like AAA superfamily ATPase